MTEENNTPESTTEPEKPTRPRREDGTFMSKAEIDTINEERKDRDKYIIENNQVLLRGTGLSKDHFKGMNPRQINKFLLNFHKKKEEEAATQTEAEKEPNTPILGTPIGSGKQIRNIDEFLDIKIKDGRPDITFDCPASIAFGKSKDKKEARNKWLEAH